MLPKDINKINRYHIPGKKVLTELLHFFLLAFIKKTIVLKNNFK